jgi:outer membrane protein
MLHLRIPRRMRAGAVFKSGGRSWRWTIIGATAACCVVRSAVAETMPSALVRAYVSNPDLNQQRANVRVRDEDVPKAAAGMRPKASVSINGGPQFSRIRQPAGRDESGARIYSSVQMLGQPRGATAGVSQVVFDGWRTENSIRQAESGIFAARANARLAEQTTLLNAVTAYMNVLRDTAVLRLRKNNIAVLDEQLRVTRDRYEFGEVTNTDVAQARASLAKARTEFYAAESVLKTSAASYRQVIGVEPSRLEPARTVEHLLPKLSDDAIQVGILEHPSAAMATHQTDAAELAVKVAEGALLPTVSVSAQVSQQYDSYLVTPGTRQFSAQVNGVINMPIYQGGTEYASIRQAKQQLGQARLNADVQRDVVRAAVVSSYGQLNTARASIASAREAVKAAEVALKGVRDEAFFGQRTTLDVLNAQQALLNARVDLTATQRDRVVSSYTALAAIGRLSASMLNLDVELYDPSVNYEHVKTKWVGLSISDGR